MGKHCIYCGTPLPEAASFCPHCARSQIVKKPMRPPRFRRKAAAVLAVLVLGMGLLCLTRWKMNQMDRTLSQETLPPETETLPPETETTAAPTQAATAPTEPLPPRLEIHEETAAGGGGCTVLTTNVKVYVQAENSQTQNRLAGSYRLRTITQSPQGFTMEELYLPTGTRFSIYSEADHGYLEYTELYENGQMSDHIIAFDGTDAEEFIYEPDGTRTSHTWQADGPAYIAEKRKTLDDMIALLEEQLSEQQK